jgi:VanZ family protein
MKNLKIFFLYWLPVFIVMITIFVLSSRQRINVSDTKAVNFSIFKTLHILEYAFLYFLLFRAYFKTLGKKNQKRAYIYAMIVSIIYAVSDEIHQSFTPTREPSVRDITFDAIGIYLMFQYTKNYLHHFKWIL